MVKFETFDAANDAASQALRQIRGSIAEYDNTGAVGSLWNLCDLARGLRQALDAREQFLDHEEDSEDA